MKITYWHNLDVVATQTTEPALLPEINDYIEIKGITYRVTYRIYTPETYQWKIGIELI